MFTILTFLKSKDQAFTVFTNYKSLTEKQLNLQVKCVQCDGGGEYTSNNEFYNEFLFLQHDNKMV